MASRFYEGAKHASLYLQFRPTTPLSLIRSLADYVHEQVSGPLQQAVDVGCGSGQGTQLLASHFRQVLGTDISAAQISEATAANRIDGITYRVSPAEEVPLPAGSSQLMMTVQAAHWFDMPRLFAEARRVLSPGGVLALVGYRLPLPLYKGEPRPDLRDLLVESYMDGLKSWVQQGSVEVYIDNYSHPRFQSPLCDLRRDNSSFCDLAGSVGDLVGYCSTWSGFQRMVTDRGQQAGAEFLSKLQHRIIEKLGEGADEESPLTMRFEYFALLSRRGD